MLLVLLLVIKSNVAQCFAYFCCWYMQFAELVAAGPPTGTTASFSPRSPLACHSGPLSEDSECAAAALLTDPAARASALALELEVCLSTSVDSLT